MIRETIYNDPISMAYERHIDTLSSDGKKLFDTTKVRYDRPFWLKRVGIKKVIHNKPATVVFWSDGTKTVVKCQKEDMPGYSERVGLLMCVAKKFFGNTGKFNDILGEWSSDDVPDFRIPTLDDLRGDVMVNNTFRYNKKN